MDAQQFREYVTNWVNTMDNADSVKCLHNFIANSDQSKQVKDELHRIVDTRVNELEGRPTFIQLGNNNFLADQHGNARLFSTRFTAYWKIIQLKFKGYNAELVPGEYFYKIALGSPAYIKEIS